jgi:S-adenosylmethionine:tRNA ribosyltransferase-isomerase
VKTSDFDYDLPPEYIAQIPIEPRDSARLLVLNRRTGRMEHSIFRRIGDYLKENDLLILNETRVIPARLYGWKIPSGGRVEILLLRRSDPLTWEAWGGGKGLRIGKRIQIEDGPQAEIVEVMNGPLRKVRFDTPIEPFLQKIGHVPLPPYIRTELRNQERYQTVYAQNLGSAAAPTAGLHFTPELLEDLLGAGVRLAYITLHVGLDTFAPVTQENPLDHEIHTEWCQVSTAVADSVRQTRLDGGRVIAVGTTSVRTLESAARHALPGDLVAPFCGSTDLFILPGYKFSVVDAMITNFHLPHSTLLMLVSAFAGRERILAAYEEAKRLNYRFYSFGDAMLIL